MMRVFHVLGALGSALLACLLFAGVANRYEMFVAGIIVAYFALDVFVNDIWRQGNETR